MPRVEAPTAALAAPALRLALARSLAWALLIGGWLALGALGRQHAAQAAGGLAPVALWLAALGTVLAFVAHRSWPVAALRRTLIGAGLAAAAAAAALAGPAPWLGLGALSMAWALLLVAASLCVRLLRRGAAARPPPPTLPALAGAALAWAWAGEPAHWLSAPASQGAVLAVVALLLAGLLPRRAAPVTACRAGLFDCALALAPLATWRRPTAWPQATAALAMLPMMATLALMADWCGAAGVSPQGSSATHLAAMLAPALLGRAWGVAGRALIGGSAAAVATAALLVLGGLALFRLGLDGLMTAGLLHGMAWGLAWSARWSLPTGPADAAAATDAPRATPGRPGAAAALPAAWAGALVLALGGAIAQWGPDALATVHALLAAMGAVGALALASRRLAAPAQPAAGTARRRRRAAT